MFPRSTLKIVPFLVIGAAIALSARVTPQFAASTNLVVLNARVTDGDGKHVSGLSEAAFRVSEDGRPQTVSVFSNEDAPVTAGVIIDSSMSMWAIRDQLIEGAVAFARGGHPDNELFAIAFNEERWPALPPTAAFTSDPGVLHEALKTVVQARGRTGLFDAIISALRYAERGTLARKALVLISDGGDNASTSTFKEVIDRAQASNAVIYGVALVDPLDREAKPELIRQLARATGGDAFTPKNVGDLKTALQRVAEDIRHSYTIGYVPSETSLGYHALKVDVSATGRRNLRVKTREGYRLLPRDETSVPAVPEPYVTPEPGPTVVPEQVPAVPQELPAVPQSEEEVPPSPEQETPRVQQ